MPELQKIVVEVPVQQSGTNTRIGIPKTFVEMFGIHKWDKNSQTGDWFVWEYDPETNMLSCHLKEKAGGGAV
jgi:hypothetical protein